VRGTSRRKSPRRAGPTSSRRLRRESGLVLILGADEVIDYRTHDFVAEARGMDVVLDPFRWAKRRVQGKLVLTVWDAK
jgi:hypothetical protein